MLHWYTVGNFDYLKMKKWTIVLSKTVPLIICQNNLKLLVQNFFKKLFPNFVNFFPFSILFWFYVLCKYSGCNIDSKISFIEMLPLFYIIHTQGKQFLDNDTICSTSKHKSLCILIY